MNQSVAAAFLNHKGGVGKTTSVVNVGAGLAIQGRRVLIVDLDPQGHLTRFLDIDRGDIDKTVFDVLRGEVPVHDAILTRPLKARMYMDGQERQLSMSVLPASLAFCEAEMTLSRSPHRTSLLKNALDPILGDYDHVLFDCSPSLGLVSINALVASQLVFIPVQTEQLALESLDDLMTKVEAVTTQLNPDLEIGGLIATRFDGRKVLSRMVVQSLRERFGALLLNSMIRDCIALAESPSVGKDIFSYRPKSFGAEDYLNLSLEILDRMTTIGSPFSVEQDLLEIDESDTFVM